VGREGAARERERLDGRHCRFENRYGIDTEVIEGRVQ
jgi:hypothetical protein